MKYLLIASLCFFLTPSKEWLTDFNKATGIAREEKKLILLNFSGSDWCAPCVRTKKEIFDTEDFKSFADKSLVLVNADFPRNKKNKLPSELQLHNDRLADKYNPSGIFPLTALLSSDGKLIHVWEGYPAGGKEGFLKALKEQVDKNAVK